MGSATTFTAIFIIPQIGNLNFLIDTGASVSLLPSSFAKRFACEPCATKITAADGRPLDVVGHCNVEIVSRQLRRTYMWTFILANVSQPILGADFLAHYKLLVDCSAKRILDQETTLSVHGATTTTSNYVRPLFSAPSA